MKVFVLLVPVMLLACSPAADTPAVQSETGGAEIVAAQAPADAFVARLNTLCGQTFEGKVVTDDPLDADFASQRLVMTVRDCSAAEVRIPFHVGEDKSRTWIVTRTDTGLRLKHDHRHEDGTEDLLSQYGGDTSDAGTAGRQEFPADAFSKDLFEREGNPASVDNVWAMEANDQVFAYELRRPERFFRVEFDLAAPVAQ
jgi:hypothetical protein